MDASVGRAVAAGEEGEGLLPRTALEERTAPRR